MAAGVAALSGFRGTPDGLWTVEHMVLSGTSVTGIWDNPPGDGELLLVRYAGRVWGWCRDDAGLKELGVPVADLAEIPGYRLPGPGPGGCPRCP
jgi:hypothetical protein